MPADSETLIVKNPADVIRHLITIQFDVSNVQLGGQNCDVVIARRNKLKTTAFNFSQRPVVIKVWNLSNASHIKADLLYDYSNDEYPVMIEVHTKNTSAFSWDAFWETKRSLEYNRKIQQSQDANLDSSVKTYYDLLYLGNEILVSDQDGGPHQINIQANLKVRSRQIGSI